MKTLFLSLAIILVLCSTALLFSQQVFGQIESIEITGPKRVLKDSVFNFSIDIKGISRASYGDFSVVLSLIEKPSGRIIIENPEFLVPGKNTITYWGRGFSSGNEIILTSHIPHLFRIQHTNQIWEYEFLPVDTVEELTPPENQSTKININQTKTISSNETSEMTLQQSKKIPDWIKNTLKWYVDGLISEDEILSAMQFLIKERIIKID